MTNAIQSLGVGLLVLGQQLLPAQQRCTGARPLPAYAHNDYLNRRPLYDALEAGFRGAEADVFLVRGRLVVAHDRRTADHPDTSTVVRLVSLNYGKEAGWQGVGPMDQRTVRVIRALIRARNAATRRLARVHNVPPKAAIYRALLDEGVDLIAARDLVVAHQLLTDLRP